MKTLLLSILFLCLLPLPVFAENKGTPDLDSKWQLLEERNKIIAESYEAKQKKLDEHFKLQIQAIDSKMKEMDDYKTEVDKQLAIGLKEMDTRFARKEVVLDFVIEFIGPISLATLLAIFLGILKIYRMIPEMAEAQAKEKFDRHFEEEFEKRFQAKESDIRKLIRLQDEEIRLKREKRILVLSKQGAARGFLERFFGKMGFENVVFDDFDPSQTHLDKDMILFNNYDVNIAFDEQEIIDYAQQTDEATLVFYFGRKHIQSASLKDNFASTTFKTQLYGNLMNALRYQRML